MSPTTSQYYLCSANSTTLQSSTPSTSSKHLHSVFESIYIQAMHDVCDSHMKACKVLPVKILCSIHSHCSNASTADLVRESWAQKFFTGFWMTKLLKWTYVLYVQLLEHLGITCKLQVKDMKLLTLILTFTKQRCNQNVFVANKHKQTYKSKNVRAALKMP